MRANGKRAGPAWLLSVAVCGLAPMAEGVVVSRAIDVPDSSLAGSDRRPMTGAVGGDWVSVQTQVRERAVVRVVDQVRRAGQSEFGWVTFRPWGGFHGWTTGGNGCGRRDSGPPQQPPRNAFAPRPLPTAGLVTVRSGPTR
jgi:hypothetical protein